jgi:hypothetical protein
MDWEGLSLSKQALRGFHHGITRGQFLSLLLAFAEQYLHSDIAAICLGKHSRTVSNQHKQFEIFCQHYSA